MEVHKKAGYYRMIAVQVGMLKEAPPNHQRGGASTQSRSKLIAQRPTTWYFESKKRKPSGLNAGLEAIGPSVCVDGYEFLWGGGGGVEGFRQTSNQKLGRYTGGDDLKKQSHESHGHVWCLGYPVHISFCRHRWLFVRHKPA